MTTGLVDCLALTTDVWLPRKWLSIRAWCLEASPGRVDWQAVILSGWLLPVGNSRSVACRLFNQLGGCVCVLEHHTALTDTLADSESLFALPPAVIPCRC